jgi:hypothetical protein
VEKQQQAYQGVVQQ